MPSKSHNPLKLYTKSGDTGQSGLVNGTRLPKHHPIFSVLGDLDELNSALGVAVVALEKKYRPEIFLIQHKLLDIGALVAGSQNPKLINSDISWLETKIDHHQSHFGSKWYVKFLLPGGSEPAARIDLARSVCRRTERSFNKLINSNTLGRLEIRSIRNSRLIAAYLNRLSDYLYSLRCKLNFDNQVQETTH